MSCEGVRLSIGWRTGSFFFCVRPEKSRTYDLRVLGKQNIESSWEWGKAIVLLFFVPFLGHFVTFVSTFFPFLVELRNKNKLK